MTCERCGRERRVNGYSLALYLKDDELHVADVDITLCRECGAP